MATTLVTKKEYVIYKSYDDEFAINLTFYSHLLNTFLFYIDLGDIYDPETDRELLRQFYSSPSTKFLEDDQKISFEDFEKIVIGIMQDRSGEIEFEIDQEKKEDK